MGHRQEMTHGERLKWDTMQYQAALEAKRGHNFTYWDDSKHDKLFNEGWQIYRFPINHSGKTTEMDSTMSEAVAKETKESLIADGYLARIFCGYQKNVQRIKTFSLLYKLKPRKSTYELDPR